MKQLHFHERGVHVTLYNATTRALYDRYDEFNSVVEELEALGREDLVRQGFAPEDVRYRLELDMRYGNQLLTQAVALEDINRMNGVGDVLAMIRTFGDVYSHRFGAASAAPEAGIRCNTVRVASYVDGDVVSFDSLEAGGGRSVPTEASRREVQLHRARRAGRHPGLRPERPHPHERDTGSGHRDDREHHLPRRARLAAGADAAGRGLVPAGLTTDRPGQSKGH